MSVLESIISSGPFWNITDAAIAGEIQTYMITWKHPAKHWSNEKPLEKKKRY